MMVMPVRAMIYGQVIVNVREQQQQIRTMTVYVMPSIFVRILRLISTVLMVKTAKYHRLSSMKF